MPRDGATQVRRVVDPIDVERVGLLLGQGGYLLAGLFLDLAYARYFWLLIGLAVAAGVILAPERATDSTLAPASALDAGDARPLPTRP